MKRVWVFLILLGLVVTVTGAYLRAGEAEETQPAAAVTNPWADQEQAVAMLQGYLARMNQEAKLDASKEYPVLNATVKMTKATHHVRIVIDAKREIVYVFLNRYLEAKPDSSQLPAVLQRLMEENWNLNIGKFEWDKSDGEIRFSYCFTTENGIGYESFDAIYWTLLNTGDKLWPELSALAKG